ncbi:MAG: MarR family winged helix-turn-helix transcriptional regulator [archaeon]|nr:MarR family winged helix-turn-helix transcriptional regulator [archaeon]
MVISSDDAQFDKMFTYIPNRIGKWLKTMADEYFEGTELRSYQVPFIIAISEHEGITQKELKALIPCDKSRISVIVNELIEMGFVEDRCAGRQTALHLTEEGRVVLATCKIFTDLAKHKLTSCFTPEEKVIFKSYLKRLDEHLDVLNKEL